MNLVTNQTYRVVTLDTASDEGAVSAALEDAQALVEEYLRRPLEAIARTEKLKVASDGRVYPRATPIASVTNGHTIEGEGHWLSGGTAENFLLVASDSQEVTYVGGYTPDTIPHTLRDAIIWTAWERLRRGEGADSEIPLGASTVALGDASVSFRDPGAGGTSGGLPMGVASSIRRWVRREP